MFVSIQGLLPAERGIIVGKKTGACGFLKSFSGKKMDSPSFVKTVTSLTSYANKN